MLPEKVKLPDVDDLSLLSGLPESIMASDLVGELERDLMRLGKPEKEAQSILHKVVEAFSAEREKAVEACYMAGYLKGMADMGLRVKHLLETRGEMEASGEMRRKVA
jgi:hypothetical protein